MYGGSTYGRRQMMTPMVRRYAFVHVLFLFCVCVSVCVVTVGRRAERSRRRAASLQTLDQSHRIPCAWDQKLLFLLVVLLSSECTMKYESKGLMVQQGRQRWMIGLDMILLKASKSCVRARLSA